MDPTADVCTPYPPFGPDTVPLSFPPEWRTETVLALAHAVRADNAFDLLPILADALEEAGCDDPRVLDHCRFCERHQPRCWVIERVVPSDGLNWTGEMRDRLAAAVAEAASQGHPDDPDVVPGRKLPYLTDEEREARDALAFARAEKRGRAVVFVARAFGIVIVAMLLWALLQMVFRF